MGRSLRIDQLIDDRPDPTSRTLGAVDRAFAGLLRDMQAVRGTGGSRFKFRPSNASFCRWAAMLAELLGPDQPAESIDFAGDYYRTIGRATHEVVQRWLGRTGHLYGDFECRTCRTVVRSQGWSQCPEGCRTDWLYREFDLSGHDPTGLLTSASIDGLVHFARQEPDHYWLIDIKTCSMSGLPRPEVGFTRDYHLAHIDQTAIYRALLERAGFAIDGTVFLMVPRDKPARAVAIPVEQPAYDARFHQLADAWLASRNAAQTGELAGCTRKCASRLDDPECRFHALCWDDQATDREFVQRIGRPPVRA